jgi:hypothetical protein
MQSETLVFLASLNWTCDVVFPIEEGRERLERILLRRNILVQNFQI